MSVLLVIYQVLLLAALQEYSSFTSNCFGICWEKKYEGVFRCAIRSRVTREWSFIPECYCHFQPPRTL